MASLKDKISFILYEDNRIPRYLQFSRGTYNFFFHAPIVLFTISLLILAGSYFYISNIEQYVRSREPKIIKELQGKNNILALRANELEATIKELTEKLNTPIASSNAIDALSFFSPIKGQKNLTSPAKVNIQDINISNANNSKLNVRFNIINTTVNNEKLSGYIHVFLTDGTNFKRFPKTTEELENFHFNFNSGESFATSRFRPVEAVFDNISAKNVILKIIIFNRVGDLIHQQQFKKEL
jgi:hypothetical protein